MTNCYSREKQLGFVEKDLYVLEVVYFLPQKMSEYHQVPSSSGTTESIMSSFSVPYHLSHRVEQYDTMASSADGEHSLSHSKNEILPER